MAASRLSEIRHCADPGDENGGSEEQNNHAKLQGEIEGAGVGERENADCNEKQSERPKPADTKAEIGGSEKPVNETDEANAEDADDVITLEGGQAFSV